VDDSPRTTHDQSPAVPDTVDWHRVARLVLTSRALDHIEETVLVPDGLVTYQFSAGGHELAQVLLGLALDHPHDAASVYYRSRPFMLAAGLTPESALSATKGRQPSPNGGRDIGVVFSLTPRDGGPTVLPMSGAVGTQYTPAAGWASAIAYRQHVLGDMAWQGALAMASGGEGSASTPGFWAALNIATTQRLPLLIVIEDNGYAISVPSTLQTPGANIAANLGAFENLLILDGDGTDPVEAAELVGQATRQVRAGNGPVLLRLVVPRLQGHSYTDTQAYKSPEVVAEEEARDPLPRLKMSLVPRVMSAEEWSALEHEVETEVAEASARARAHPEGDPAGATRYVFFDSERPQAVGGTRPEGAGLPLDAAAAPEPPDPVRINTVDAIRRTLEHEMSRTKRVVVFGEDVGLKGGVHGATRDMQGHFGAERVFDTTLNEEGIIGRAVGMAYAGLVPVPEIQFRKYADPATEQLNDCGTVRWRTDGRFAAPVVVRIPVGFARATGDPWHSVSGEAVFAHSVGWRVAMPSNAEDAVGLLRTALRGDDPTYFLEHRALYDGAAARRPYPGDAYQLPFGRAAVVQPGDQLTVVTWGEFVHRCQAAAKPLGDAVEIIDLRTIVPWDRETVLESVRRTGRCLVAHEDTRTAGFGGEIASVVAEEAFTWLDAPVARIASADCPVPYSRFLIPGVVPSVEAVRARMEHLLEF
jgi:2-oxoisovalerate dehydrogenase E1 component